MELTEISSALASTFSVTDIATVIGACLAGGGTLYLTWFGARKLVSAVRNAFSKGKLKV